MLRVDDVHVAYGQALAVRGVTLDVSAGELVALVGSNGAGKSTLFKTISGLIRAQSGSVTLDGTVISKATSDQLVQMGISHVPEGRQIFGQLTVADNLRLGVYTQRHRLKGLALAARIDEVCVIFPALRHRLQTLAARLSGGQQQMLAIARGLMMRPKVLLLDEPSLGLSPILVYEILRVLRSLTAAGTAVLLAEQNARLSLLVADRGYVMENGRFVMTGLGEELLLNDEVKERYLGVGTSDFVERDDDAMTARLRQILPGGRRWER